MTKEIKTVLDLRVQLTNDVPLPEFAGILREIADRIDEKHLSSHGDTINLALVNWFVSTPKSDKQERIEDEVDQCPFCGCGCSHAQSGDKCATCNESP